MKRFIIIWNILLGLTFILIFILHYITPKGRVNVKKISTDTTSNNSNKIAYFDMDSLASNLNLVKELKSELILKEEILTNEISKSTSDFQKKYKLYQELLEKGQLSPSSLDSIKKVFEIEKEALENKNKTIREEHYKYMSEKQAALNTLIEEFLKDFNKIKNYGYIISFEPSLFYFKDPAFDITSEIIKSLNEKYKLK